MAEMFEEVVDVERLAGLFGGVFGGLGAIGLGV